MSVLYVTTFNEKLYLSSGHKMLESFKQMKVEGDFVVCTEGMIYDDGDFSVYDLDNDSWLKEWTKKNEDIIPVHYGGIATEVDDGKILEKWGTRFNMQAARWFRKIVALNFALANFDFYKYIIFCDCDIIFTKRLTEDYVAKVFSDCDVFYHLGQHRRKRGTGIESGFIGFKRGLGYDFLREVFKKFDSGDFRKYQRWDDGYVFRAMIVDDGMGKQYNCKDIAEVPDNQIIGGHVVKWGPFKNFISHDKGKHQREGLIKGIS